MAIDSSIPLSVQPAQIANPADIFAKAQALRMSQQQQQQESQINKVKLTEAQMQLKQQQQDQQDQQIIRKAYMDSGGDLDDFMSRATKYGAQPSTIIKLKQTILDTKKKSLEMDDATRKNHLEKSDQIRGMMTPVDEALDKGDVAGAERMFAQQYTYADQQGLIDDQTKKSLAQYMPKGFNPEGYKMLKATLATGTQLLKEADEQKKTQAQLETAESRKLTAQQGVDDKAKNDAAAQFGSIKPDSPDAAAQYKKILDNLPRKIANQFPDESAFAKDPQGTIQQARKVGMTPAQQETAEKEKTPSVEQEKLDAKAELLYGPGKKLKDLTATGKDKVIKAVEKDKAMNSSTIIMQGEQQKDAKDVAKAVMDGNIPPDLSTVGYRDKEKVTAELARAGFNQSRAVTEWKGVQRFMATAQGPQQLRMRQAIEKIGPHVDLIDNLYGQLEKKGLPTGFKVWNAAALAAAKNVPGETGAIASNLLGQISDLNAELGNVYMAGNAPTDQAFKMASNNLKSEWNPQTFHMAIDLIKKNVDMRRNAIRFTGPAGIPRDSPYMPPEEEEQKPKTSVKPKSDPLGIF